MSGVRNFLQNQLRRRININNYPLRDEIAFETSAYCLSLLVRYAFCVLIVLKSVFVRIIPMAYKMKGIFKGIKEHVMQIGSPTDVKHVAHIGWDGMTGNASPSWMNDIRTSSELLSLGNFATSAGTSWASQDFDQLRESSNFATPSLNTSLQQDAAQPPDIPRPPAPAKRRRKRRPGSESTMAPASDDAGGADAKARSNCKSET
uniref:CRIB domain-containing protein n=1 Tax=Leersia perrieri TaxID=77586 RepID=A0A0D9W9V5_9ORYZ